MENEEQYEFVFMIKWYDYILFALFYSIISFGCYITLVPFSNFALFLYFCIMGFLGTIPLLLVLYDYWKLKKRKKKQGSEQYRAN